MDTPGPFTREKLQAKTSLDAYVFYMDGWVRTCEYRRSGTGFCVIRAMVNRSQAVTQDPHQAWVAVRESDNTIECGRCTCMAGLGEVCSHVAAILYKVEASVRYRKQQSCTELPCLWNQTYVKTVEAVPLEEINFEKPRREKKQRPVLYEPQLLEDTVPDDPTDLLRDLKTSCPDAVVFTVVEPKPTLHVQEKKLPVNLTSLHKDSHRELDSGKLSDVCDEIFSSSIQSTPKQNIKLENLTKKQSKSGLWHKYRRGRLTSSLFYEAIHTKPDDPSISLVKKVVYGSSFQTRATKWGKDNEQTALKEYASLSTQQHRGLKVDSAGFKICDELPFLGTSPDAYVTCDCCGKGTVEVKCPFKHRNESPCDIKDHTFCLKVHERHESAFFSEGLRYNHPYFYQIQGQMGISQTDYCDFVCYTPRGIHIERVLFDPDFFKTMVEKLTVMFRKCILPELLTNSFNISGNITTENLKPKCKRSRIN